MDNDNRDRAGWEDIFAGVDIVSPDLMEIISDTFAIILPLINARDVSFGFIIEQPTTFGQPVEVTVDGDINVNYKKLKKYDRELAMTIMAHEFAHVILEHFNSPEGLQNEIEADELLEKWGFNVKRLIDEFGACPGVELRA